MTVLSQACIINSHMSTKLYMYKHISFSRVVCWSEIVYLVQKTERESVHAKERDETDRQMDSDIDRGYIYMCMCVCVCVRTCVCVQVRVCVCVCVCVYM